jgi:hypothetical protein
MPKGVYHHKRLSDRDPEVAAKIRACLALGRMKPAREKARESFPALSPEWRQRVSDATRQALHRPDVRQKHLAGLAGQPVNFKGGNGQHPVPKVVELAAKLEPAGFIREYVVRTNGHGLPVNCPNHYKVDFGHPQRRIAVEVDGPSHRPMARRALDQKKTAVLRELGWRVVRVRH